MNSTIPDNIFKSYDIRGIYPDELNEDNIYHIIQAVFVYIAEKLNKKNIKIVIGRDMRVSGPALYPQVQKALIDSGAEITDIGLVSTPSMYFAVHHYKYDAGIQLSASHNPSNYNGLKMVINTPNGLIKIGKGTGMETVHQYAKELKSLQSDTKGTITTKENVLRDEVQNAINIVKPHNLKTFKIVADPANAMGATYIEELFKHIPGDIIKMNFELDGTFPAHQPDPLVAGNVKTLRERVISEKADFGLAPDGDGDRMFFIDEKGEVVPASFITALVARELLKKNPGATILYDIRYCLTPKKIIEENGGVTGVTKVGHAFITNKMNDTGAIFGGESSGHYFFKDTGNAESQLPIILMVMKVMSEENKPLSEIKKEVQRSFESGETNFKTSNGETILKNIQTKYSDGILDSLDGVAINYHDWRFIVRTSNTEPLLRLNVEALTEDLMMQKKKELVQLITANGGEKVDH